MLGIRVTQKNKNHRRFEPRTVTENESEDFGYYKEISGKTEPGRVGIWLCNIPSLPFVEGN